MFPAAAEVCQRSLTSQCAGTRCARASLKMARVGDASGLFENNAREIGMRRSGLNGEIGAQVFTNEDDGIHRNVTGSSQVGDRRTGIFAPPRFTGVDEAALPISAIVKSKNIQPRCVQSSKRVNRVANVAVGAMQINRGKVRLRRCGNPPAAQLRIAGWVGGKPDGIER